jgi:hypothetical protein
MGNLLQQKQIEGLGGGALTPSNHKTLDQLVHNIAETSYEEYIRSGNQVTDIIIWTDSGKTTKIREENFTYSAGKISTIVTKQYDGAGVLAETLTDTYNFTGNQLTSIDRVFV